jgi:hypothetical protein
MEVIGRRRRRKRGRGRVNEREIDLTCWSHYSFWSKE